MAMSILLKDSKAAYTTCMLPLINKSREIKPRWELQAMTNHFIKIMWLSILYRLINSEVVIQFHRVERSLKRL